MHAGSRQHAMNVSVKMFPLFFFRMTVYCFGFREESIEQIRRSFEEYHEYGGFSLKECVKITRNSA